MCSCIWSMQERRTYSKNGHCFMINISSNWMSSRIMAHLQFFSSRNHPPSLWPSKPKIQVIQAVKFFIPKRWRLPTSLWVDYEGAPIWRGAIFPMDFDQKLLERSVSSNLRPGKVEEKKHHPIRVPTAQQKINPPPGFFSCAVGTLIDPGIITSDRIQHQKIIMAVFFGWFFADSIPCDETNHFSLTTIW